MHRNRPATDSPDSGLVATFSLAALILAASASAHPVTIDHSIGDWMTSGPPIMNLGEFVRGSGQVGEYVWVDVPDDHGTDLFSVPGADLRQFRVTADATRLYFLVRTASTAWDNPFPSYQIAVDLDRATSSGQTSFAGFADTQVAADAAWEFLIQTRYAPTFSVVVLDPAFNTVATGAVETPGAGTTAWFEIAVDWSSLGLDGPPSTPLRITVASFLERFEEPGVTWDIGGPSVSNAIDGLTNYGDPRSSGFPATAVEIADQVVDYHVDLWFESDGEVMSPLLISEVLSDAPASGVEWVELQARVPIGLEGFRIGDEETPDGAEGMAVFPAGATASPGQSIVVTNFGTSFTGFYGFPPTFETSGTDLSIPDLVADGAWASTAAFGLVNAGDEVIVLDPSWTVLDVYRYGAGFWPSTGATTVPAQGRSYERIPPVLDSNASSDFRLQISPTPGTGPVAVGPPTAPTRLALSTPWPNPARTHVRWSIQLARECRVRLEVFDLMGRRMCSLMDSSMPAGAHDVVWDLKDDRGRPVGAGRYEARLTDGRSIARRSMIRIP